MTIKYRELKRRYELEGAAKRSSTCRKRSARRHLKPEDFSIRDLAEGLVPDGHEWVRLLDPRSAGGVNVLEAGDGVDVTAFLNITGQVIYSKIMEAYTQEAFVVSKLVDTIPTRLDGEKIPGIARLADDDRRSRIPACRIRIWASARITSKRRRRRSAASSCRSRRRRFSSTARTWC